LGVRFDKSKPEERAEFQLSIATALEAKAWLSIDTSITKSPSFENTAEEAFAYDSDPDNDETWHSTDIDESASNSSSPPHKGEPPSTPGPLDESKNEDISSPTESAFASAPNSPVFDLSVVAEPFDFREIFESIELSAEKTPIFREGEQLAMELASGMTEFLRQKRR